MTPQERQVLEDAEAQAFESSQIESDDEATGVPKPPVIESTETVLEANVFGFEFAGQPTATAEPGPGSPPPPDDDPTGACCIAGICSIRTEAFCTESGGTYEGDDTTCDPNPCPQLGACCDDGDCNNTFEEECAGTWHSGESCSGTLGACCDEENNCTVTTQLCCEEDGGTYKGDDTTCDSNPCEEPGACCDLGGCTITTEAECGGVYQGNGTTCEDACCLCFQSPQDGQFYCNKTVTAVVSGSNPGGCDCTLDANFSSTFSCDPLTGTVTPTGCSGTWHKVVLLTTGFLCTPSDVTDNWEFQTGCSGPDRCGWNSSCANPEPGECCGGFAGCSCGIASLDTYADDCSCDCCPASPGCYNVDITVIYS